MTNEEIIEAERLITSIKSDLAIVAGGATNAEERANLVLEKVPDILVSLAQLAEILESAEDYSRIQDGMSILLALAEMAQRRPEYHEMLARAIMMLRIGCGLDKVAQNLCAVKLQQSA